MVVNKRKTISERFRLRTTKVLNLGLVRIVGSTDAQHCLESVKSKLLEFDIGFKDDVICIITDGCSMMASIGAQIKPIGQQMCFAHAIQLAVLNVLYLKPAKLAKTESKKSDVVHDELGENDNDEESSEVGNNDKTNWDDDEPDCDEEESDSKEPELQIFK